MESPQKVSSRRPSEHHYSQADLERVLAHDLGHVVVHTSGSTGEPKGVVIGRDALLASADATHRVLDGPGQWLLTLDTHHIAGIAVLSRSVIAGTSAIAVPSGRSFDPELFSQAVEQLTFHTLYTSLVPTQLHRLLQEVQTAGPFASATLAGLQSFNAILVGGAATSQHALEYARGLGINVVTTYGMSETSGGCVYNNHPFDNVAIKLDHERRIHIASDVLASGYLAAADVEHQADCLKSHELLDSAAFATDSDGIRWHRTNDLGVMDPLTRELTILGRADDVILSGGLNIAPALIENALGGQFSIGQLCVVGVPDPEWGHKVVALYTSSTAPHTDELPLAQIKDHLNSTLGTGYLPRAFFRVDRLPHTTSGKIDRRAAAELAVAKTRKA